MLGPSGCPWPVSERGRGPSVARGGGDGEARVCLPCWRLVLAVGRGVQGLRQGCRGRPVIYCTQSPGTARPALDFTLPKAALSSRCTSDTEQPCP